MVNFINACRQVVNVLKTFLGVITTFVPSWIVALVSAFFLFIFLILVIKIIGKILDAIPIA